MDGENQEPIEGAVNNDVPAENLPEQVEDQAEQHENVADQDEHQPEQDPELDRIENQQDQPANEQFQEEQNNQNQPANEEFQNRPNDEDREEKDDNENSDIEFIENEAPLQEESFQENNLSRVAMIHKKIAEDLATKEAEENKRKESLRQQAKRELELWYTERERQMERNRTTMKDEEQLRLNAALEKSDNRVCDWQKVIRMLEFSGGTAVKPRKDLSRMKAVLLNAARHSEKRNAEQNY